jgi:phosphoribosylaminoimidazole carboxylase
MKSIFKERTSHDALNPRKGLPDEPSCQCTEMTCLDSLHYPLQLGRATISWASTIASSNIDTATIADVLQQTITPLQQSTQPVTNTANMDYAPINPPESSDSSLPSQADPQTAPRKPIIGILGGGHFCRMLRQSAKGLPVELVILDRPGCPAKRGVSSSTPDNFDGSHETEAWVRELAAKVDIITVKHEHVNSKVLREIEKNGVAITVDGKSRMKKVEVHPSPDTISITQDKYALKSHLTEHGFYSRDEIQTLILSMGQLSTAVEAMSSYWGYPLFLKSQRPSLYNSSSFKIKNKEDIDKALAALRGQPRYLEKWLPVAKELAVSVERTTYDSEGLTYGSHVVETVYEDGICTQVFNPARIALDLRARALVLACNVVETFTGRGLYTVKMFVLENGK